MSSHSSALTCNAENRVVGPLTVGVNNTDKWLSPEYVAVKVHISIW